MHKDEQVDNSGKLFDYLRAKFKLNSEGELAIFCNTQPSVISEIRHGKRVVNDILLVRICTKTGMTLKKAQGLIKQQ